MWNLKKNEQRTDWCLPEAGEMSKGGQRVQTSSYKVSPGDMMYSVVTIVKNIALCIWKLQRE